MVAEILCVGTELLLGDTVNTNAAYIASQLSKIGINVYHQSVVGDNDVRLESAIKTALKNCDILITTGGLGPTYDDITKETVAKIFGKELILNNEILKDIKSFFNKINRNMSENNVKQAMIPESAIILKNPCGTAPGIILTDDLSDKTVILLPGPPREMKAIFEKEVLPYLSNLSDKVLFSRNIRLFGIGESELEQQLRSLMKSSENPTIAPYAKDGEVLLRVTASAKNNKQALQLTEPVVDKICDSFKAYVYGVDIENLETALVNELRSKNLKIATAESCTGGLLSKRITDIPGASDVFDCGICSYSNEIKQKILNVRAENLEKFTAISKEVAKEMASGVRAISNADIGLSITGVAGPGDLYNSKAEGLVFIAIETSTSSEVIELNLSRGYENQREMIRFLASSHALFKALTVAKSLSK